MIKFLFIGFLVIATIAITIYNTEPWEVTYERNQKMYEKERQDYKKKCEGLGGKATFDWRLAPKSCEIQ